MIFEVLHASGTGLSSQHILQQLDSSLQDFKAQVPAKGCLVTGNAIAWMDLLTFDVIQHCFLLRYQDDFGPLLEGCTCYCCQRHTRAYVHHLLVTNELLAGVLLMMHNFQHYFSFFSAIRDALRDNKLDQLKNLVFRQALQGLANVRAGQWVKERIEEVEGCLLIQWDGVGWTASRITWTY